MSARILVALTLAGIVAFGVGMALRMVMQRDTATNMPAAGSTSNSERLKNREKFFGGDPERDVCGGQEMKPRW